MNRHFIYSICAATAIVLNAHAFDPFKEFEQEMQRMHTRMEKMERAMYEIFEDDFSVFKSKRNATISIDHQGNLILISAELPGLEKIEARIDDKEQTLRVTGKKEGKPVVDILIQKNVVYSSIGYEHTQETKGEDEKKSKQYAYYYADFASSLPTEVDISNADAIKVKYTQGTLTISMPTIANAVHQINVEMDKEAAATQEETVQEEAATQAQESDNSTEGNIDQEIKTITKELAA